MKHYKLDSDLETDLKKLLYEEKNIHIFRNNHHELIDSVGYTIQSSYIKG